MVVVGVRGAGCGLRATTDVSQRRDDMPLHRPRLAKWCCSLLVLAAVVSGGGGAPADSAASTTAAPTGPAAEAAACSDESCDLVPPPSRDMLYVHRRGENTITVQIVPDFYVNVQCTGNVSCAEFPRVRAEDAGAARGLRVEECGARVPPACVLAALRLRGLAELQLRGAPLAGLATLPALRGLRDLRLAGYGDESNKYWLPMEQLEALPELQELAVDAGWLALRERQFQRLRALRRLELVQAHLAALPPRAFLGDHNLTVLLSITLNNITSFQDAEVFAGLGSLRVLDLHGNNLRSLQAGVFSHLLKLETLDLYTNRLQEISEDAFQGLGSLKELNLSDNRELAALPARVFAALPALRRLRLRGCALHSLPAELLRPLALLATLQLDDNRLSDLPADLLSHKPELTELSVSRNRLQHLVPAALRGAPKLRQLWLDHNLLALEPLPHSPFAELRDLRLLDLSHNRIDCMFDDWHFLMPHLEDLDLSYNNFTGFMPEESLMFSYTTTVNLQHNQISGLRPRRLEPGEDPRTARLLLDHNPFVCDCRLWELLAPGEGGEGRGGDGTRLELGDATCAQPPALAGSALSAAAPVLACALPAGCPRGCSCELRGDCYHEPDAALIFTCDAADVDLALFSREDHDCRLDYAQLRDVELRLTTTVAGRAALSDLERIPPFVRTLNCSGLNLTGLDRVEPARRGELAVVDLRFNLLSESPALATAADGPRVFLDGNRFECDCAHRGSLAALDAAVRANSSRVPDYARLRCAGGGAVGAQAAARLCSTRDAALAGGLLAALALLTLLAALLVWRYSLQVRLFLASKGLCARWIDADDLDCRWDAFVSHSHLDEKFVRDELVPALERAPRPRALCLHYRDFVPGRSIGDNVARCVEGSRHTVVVLSGNFLSSEWGRLEVRLAVARALRGRRRGRVLLLLLEDVRGDPRLDAELRAYLDTHTYLRCDDPAFWTQLRRAVPARVRRPRAPPAPAPPPPAAAPAHPAQPAPVAPPAPVPSAPAAA